MFYSAQKSAEMNKAFSNENIFNFPAITNSKTPLLPKPKDKQKITASLDTPDHFTRKVIPKLQKITKNEKHNPISSSLIDLHQKNMKEADFFSNFMKRNSINYENKEKHLLKKLSIELDENEKHYTLKEILNFTEDDLETNFEDPRNPYVYLNSIKKKFVL